MYIFEAMYEKYDESKGETVEFTRDIEVDLTGVLGNPTLIAFTTASRKAVWMMKEGESLVGINLLAC